MTTREDFDRNLKQLESDLLTLGHLVEKSVENAVQALKDRDLEASRTVISEDDVIDRMRFQLEEQCVFLMATQQPLATDLRTLITVLHVAVELERIGDYAEGIAKISLMMGNEPPLKPLIDIPRMANKSIDMMHRGLGALMQAVDLDEDEETIKANAIQVCKDDDEVDALYDQVYRDLLTFMLQDPGTIQRATYLLWVAHNLERTADRATNIAERVMFLVTGGTVDVNASRY
jgi:phosphate transport system protein